MRSFERWSTRRQYFASWQPGNCRPLTCDQLSVTTREQPYLFNTLIKWRFLQTCDTVRPSLGQFFANPTTRSCAVPKYSRLAHSIYRSKVVKHERSPAKTTRIQLTSRTYTKSTPRQFCFERINGKVNEKEYVWLPASCISRAEKVRKGRLHNTLHD